MRRILFVAGLAALGALVTLLVAMRERETSHEAEGRRATDIAALSPGMAYAVDVDLDQADVDLDFQPSSRYVAVISALARSTSSFTVAASARPIAAPSRSLR